MLTSIVLLGITSQGCSSDDEGSAPTTQDATSAGTTDGTEPPSDITCANACARAPRCAAELVSEADCNALCEAADSPDDYACCLQYASGCAEVKACVDGSNPSCTPEGDPWVPLEMFENCSCAAEDDNAPLAQCLETGPDVACPPAASCFKPANSTKSAFCAVDCTNNAPACPEGTACEKTPKNWYCRKI
jgi:hypothetical protein